MTCTIGEPCIDVIDHTCVEKSPVGRTVEGVRALDIHPDECVDCGACEPICPIEAIYYEDDLPERWRIRIYTADHARFFRCVDSLTERLGSPGGGRLGLLGIDRARWQPPRCTERRAVSRHAASDLR